MPDLTADELAGLRGKHAELDAAVHADPCDRERVGVAEYEWNSAICHHAPALLGLAEERLALRKEIELLTAENGRLREALVMARIGLDRPAVHPDVLREHIDGVLAATAPPDADAREGE